MEPCQIFQCRYQNINIYDNTAMSFVSPNFESIGYTELLHCPISSLNPLQRRLFPVQISGLLLIRLHSDIFIGY